MKVLEVNTLQSGIDKVISHLENQQKQLKQIERSILEIIDLQGSFSGQGGSAIRGFFESYHLSFLKNLLVFYDDYLDTLEKIKRDLQLLEPATDGFIRESFLEHEVSNGLKMTKERTTSLTEEANSIISSVSDIVALPNLDASFVLHGIMRADQNRDLTIGKLHTFDQQQTSALLPLENTVQAMIQYVHQVSSLFQARNGSVPSIETIFYSQHVLQPHLSLFTYSNATLNKMSAWEHFYLNYLKSNPTPEVEPLVSDREAEVLINQATDQVDVIDEYNGINEVSTISGKYYTLPDGRILRQFYSMTGVYKYKYVDSIPEERIGSAKQTDLALISTILDFIPILSNIKGGIEASLGQDIITDRKLGTVERSILVAAILGGPLVKGAQKFGKLAMSQLPKVKNVLNPDKAKALAKDFYDDYIKNGIQSGYTAVNGLVKKMADLPMPLSPKLSTANGMSVTKTIGESMTEAKETIVQMAGKVKTSVSGKGTGKVSKEISDIPHVKEAKDIIAERAKGLDLKEHPTTTKQMSSKKMKELKDKIDNRTITKQEYADYIWNIKFAKRRDKGVKEFWYHEQQRLLNNEPLTRDWSQEQLKDIIAGKTPKYDGKSIAGHHSYSASKYPHLADRGEIIYPATFNEHLKGWHGGNWRNSIPGEPIIPIKDF